jgi:branched-chain amino acid transport system ATP-binding protein
MACSESWGNAVPHDPFILKAQGVVRRFGAFTAVDVENFAIARGAITSLIGPNGAGKSTFFNVLSGFMPPSAGRWTFDSAEISQLGAHRLARLGLIRTFQHTAVAARLSVLENVMLGAKDPSGETFLSAMWPVRWRPAERRLAEHATAVLERFKLAHLRHEPAGVLSGGQRKLLEMARALMAEPKLLMLDEPMAGVNPALRDSLLEHIVDLNRRGTSVLIIEHDMELVRRISHHVVCMAEGRVIAEGQAAQVAADPAVIAAYLGVRRAAAVARVPQPRPPAADQAPILSVQDLVAGYVPGVDVLRGCSLDLHPGEIVGIFGPNGAGKSTLLKSVFGIAHTRGGTILHQGQDITGSPGHQLVARGIGYVPQLENVFAQLTVMENLQTGVFIQPGRWSDGFDYVRGLFPPLDRLLHRRAGDLSGGERQIVALARALMLRPSLLLLDEPSAGLSPMMQEQVFEFIAAIRSQGVAVLIVEQNARRCLEICDRGYVLDQGRNAYTGTGTQLLNDERVESLYLGARPAQDDCEPAESARPHLFSPIHGAKNVTATARPLSH